MQTDTIDIVDATTAIHNNNRKKQKDTKMSAKQLKKQAQKQLQTKYMKELDWYTPFVNCVCGFQPDYTTTTSKMLIEGICAEFPTWKAYVLPANLERKRRENYKDVLNKQKILQTMSVLPISIIKVDPIKRTIELSRIRFTEDEQNAYLDRFKQLVEIRNIIVKSSISIEDMTSAFEQLFQHCKDFNIQPSKCINDCMDNYNYNSNSNSNSKSIDDSGDCDDIQSTFDNVFALNDKSKDQLLYNTFLKQRKPQACELEFEYPVIHEYASFIINDALKYVNNITKPEGDSGFKCVYGYLFMVKSKLKRRAMEFLERCKEVYIEQIKELTRTCNEDENTYKISGVNDIIKGGDEISQLDAQPNCNLMLIGHVAAGKTTITKVLTGKTTLTSSFEKETLRTRELGYATFKTTHQDGTLNKHINVMDCPGHASFMKNAISGTKGIDCILVIISAKEGVQSQTIQHLLMCYSAGFTDTHRVLVLLNKSELLSQSELKKQIRKVKKELRGTIAADALMYPISAINSVGFDSVLDWINKVQLPCKPDKTIVFPVIRSFDPNKTSKGIIGGILGVMGMSGELCIGDRIYLNPQDIVTRVVSVRSEDRTIDVAKAGGCVAIGTTLDPMFARVNKLVGSVVTVDRRESVRDITIDDVKLLGDFKFKKILKLNTSLKIQLMTSLINATIKKTSKSSRKIKMTLSSICPVLYKCQRVSIYSDKYKLYGYGTVQFGVNKEDSTDKYGNELVNEPECETIDMESANFISEQDALSRFDEADIAVQNVHVSIPPPIATADVTKVYYKNARDAVNAVNRTMEDLRKFIAEEQSTSVYVVGDGVTIVVKRQRHPCKYVENIMTQYMMKKIKCSECSCFNTRLESKGIIKCENCGAQGIV